MKKTEVYQGQNIFDKALELTRNIEDVFSIAMLNGLSVTDDLKPGDFLKVPEQINELKPESNRYASSITEQELENIMADGIGFMIIDETFIVS